MNKLSTHTHTHGHMETHLPRQLYTLLPGRPVLPVPLHYASSLIMAHSEEFGESSEPPSPAVASPSAITIGWHSHRQLPPLPWAPPLAAQMPDVCTRVCAPTCDCVLTRMCALTCTRAFIHLLICVHICGIACCLICNSLPCVNG